MNYLPLFSNYLVSALLLEYRDPSFMTNDISFSKGAELTSSIQTNSFRKTQLLLTIEQQIK